MDVSIVAAVGSFIVSERVIKAKATVIFVLLCVVCYDLSIHTNDPVSLRVYRGPALLALTLICAAFCLRTWRRNGVACDELLFLPGSVHAEKSLTTSMHPHSHTSPSNASRRGGGGGGVGPNSNGNNSLLPLNLRNGDLDANDEAIMNSVPAGNMSRISESSQIIQEHDCEDISSVEMVPLTASDPDHGNEILKSPSTSSNSPDQSTSPSKPTTLWGNISACKARNVWRRPSKLSDKTSPPSSPPSSSTCKHLKNRNSSSSEKGGFPRFFSSSQDSTNEYTEYAPSGPIVASAAIDLCMPVLINFHLFIMATNVQEKSSSSTNSSSSGSDNTNIDDETKFDNKYDEEKVQVDIPPQVLPLIFLSILSVRCVLPPKSRRRFWGIIQTAITSPFIGGVSIRDDFIGELLTSLVRPMQDVSFAIFYYFSSMYGILSGKLDLEDTGVAIKNNLLLHNIVLPICAILPLFCRFLQTLRQALDDQKRWPHLGNAFKYLTSSLVIIYGLAHAEDRRSNLWRFSFFLCVLYQLWWDIFIDWELISTTPPSSNGNRHYHRHYELGRDTDLEESFDSVSITQETNDDDNSIIENSNYRNQEIPTPPPSNTRGSLFGFNQMQLRTKRLYKSKATYWRILVINCTLRCSWMMAFIPAYHFNITTGTMEKTFSWDYKSVVGFVVSLAELVRRCCWGILKLELETIKMTDPEYKSPSSSSPRIQYKCLMPKDSSRSESNKTSTQTMKWTAYRLLVKKLFMLELLLWVVAYVLLGLWVATII